MNYSIIQSLLFMSCAATALQCDAMQQDHPETINEMAISSNGFGHGQPKRLL